MTEKVALEPDDRVGNCVLSSTSWEAQASETSVSPSVRGMRVLPSLQGIVLTSLMARVKVLAHGRRVGDGAVVTG